jgi:hypothetical protein
MSQLDQIRREFKECPDCQSQPSGDYCADHFERARKILRRQPPVEAPGKARECWVKMSGDYPTAHTRPGGFFNDLEGKSEGYSKFREVEPVGKTLPEPSAQRWSREKLEHARKAGEIAGTAEGLVWSLKNDKEFPLPDTLAYLGEIITLARSMFIRSKTEPARSGEASDPVPNSPPNSGGEVVGNPTEGKESYWQKEALILSELATSLRGRANAAESLLHDMAAYKTHLEGEVSRLREVEKRGREATDLLCRIYRNPENLLGSTMLRGDLEKFLGPDQLAFAKKNPEAGAGDDPEKGDATNG